jgi:sugar transferase EpsL
MDVTVSVTALVLLAPVLAAIAVAVCLSLGRPVLFGQLRPGRGGLPFTMRKFRTLRPPSRHGTHTGDDSPDRQTRVGQFLRRTSLDELPELLNVARGEMSLVGPRPLLMQYLPLYTPEQSRRHLVRPGITGLAQVSGRNDLPWDERFALDVYYVDHHSLRLDLRILARTVYRAAACDGTADVAVWNGG